MGSFFIVFGKLFLEKTPLNLGSSLKYSVISKFVKGCAGINNFFLIHRPALNKPFPALYIPFPCPALNNPRPQLHLLLVPALYKPFPVNKDTPRVPNNIGIKGKTPPFFYITFTCFSYSFH